MPVRSTRILSVLLLVAPVGTHGALADQFYNSGGRADFFDNSDAVRAKDAPDLILLTRVPNLFDPSAGVFTLGCFLQARRSDGSGAGYNAAALSLCFAGLVGPVGAAILMPVSSAGVVTLTALRLADRGARWK